MWQQLTKTSPSTTPTFAEEQLWFPFDCLNAKPPPERLVKTLSYKRRFALTVFLGMTPKRVDKSAATVKPVESNRESNAQGKSCDRASLKVLIENREKKQSRRASTTQGSISSLWIKSIKQRYPGEWKGSTAVFAVVRHTNHERYTACTIKVRAF